MQLLLLQEHILQLTCSCFSSSYIQYVSGPVNQSPYFEGTGPATIEVIHCKTTLLPIFTLPASAWKTFNASRFDSEFSNLELNICSFEIQRCDLSPDLNVRVPELNINSKPVVVFNGMFRQVWYNFYTPHSQESLELMQLEVHNKSGLQLSISGKEKNGTWQGGYIALNSTGVLALFTVKNGSDEANTTLALVLTTTNQSARAAFMQLISAAPFSPSEYDAT